MDNLKSKQQLESAYHKGILDGIQLMKNRLLLACENNTPIEISGKAYFISSDIDNLRGIFADLEQDNL